MLQSPPNWSAFYTAAMVTWWFFIKFNHVTPLLKTLELFLWWLYWIQTTPFGLQGRLWFGPCPPLRSLAVSILHSFIEAQSLHLHFPPPERLCYVSSWLSMGHLGLTLKVTSVRPSLTIQILSGLSPYFIFFCIVVYILFILFHLLVFIVYWNWSPGSTGTRTAPGSKQMLIRYTLNE